ncbi:cell wall-binding repeat-containing protein [Clostridium bowmanii]|uniref:cell wall-binding repeat-containing protein n=1 Tax=Clostridium bowmanii TaxID=132925 RepID=UPI001C0C5377|nr:cell wall-binding repeat-containing protein [Clostridium bowmanii]MBU3190325.1 cell wall-binding repeat-containing protein [Clostridium bowmanii]MCA1072463.1 cell wall-binding repeat-containing protein [Clostridium bowmanii]
MFKKTKNSLAMSLSVAMLATMVTIPQVASAATGTQISGKDRYETALKIVQNGWDKSESAVIARGDDLADALSAAPLAYAKGKAPILLTKTNEIPAGVLQELKDLGVKNVYIVGGVGAVSKTVADQLAGQGLTITRVQGDDRYETSLAVAKEAFGTAPADVVIANGLAYADALSVSSIAASKGMPILLVDHSKLSKEQATYIAGKSVYAVGGEGVLNADVVSATKAVRLGGADRYETNATILSKFDFDYTKLYLAKGTPANLVDSLAGSALASKTNSPIVLVDGSNKLNKKLATVVTDKIKDKTAIVRLGGTVAQSTADAVEALKTAVNVGELKVSSVSATDANTMKVTFNKAVTDTSKIVSTVTQATSPVAVTALWNTANTEVTLTKASKFVAGNYSVKVMNDTTDLGTSTVTIAEQKVSKIEITSTKLGVVNKTVNNVTTQTGYATYRILDQYGVDITNSALANNVQFQTGVGTVDAKKGLLTITPALNLNLMTFTSGIVVTANDTSTGVSTSATLTATSQIGTLSDISITKLVNVDGKVLTAGDPTTVFYADYVATDISGNPTTNYTLMEQGLILTGDHMLTTSSPYVSAQLVQNPKDSSKGLIKVVTNSESITLDMPVVITAMTWTGKTSQISTTLKKQAQVDTFTLQAPSDSIASGESKVIPFTAADQNGVAVTKYNDLVDFVTLSGAKFVKNLDGSASVKNDIVYNTGTVSVPAVISASTKTGKFSSITINIQKAVKADTLTLSETELKSTLQAGLGNVAGALQTADFDGAFTVKDQYGRDIDMLTATGTASQYQVKAYSSNNSVITAIGTATSEGAGIDVQAIGVGSATVRFDLVDTANNNTVLDSKSQTFSVLKDSDIKDYTIDAVAKPIYVVNGVNTLSAMGVTAQEAAYKANPKVYGTTATGAKVVLRGTPITGATVSNDTDFTVFESTTNVGYKAVKVIANALADKSKTEASTTLSVNILGADGAVHTVTTPITSSTVKPAAVSIDISVDSSVRGITQDGDTVTLKPVTGSYSDLLGSTLAAFVKETGAKGSQNVYFAPVDQYGKEAQSLSQFITVPTGTNVTGTFKVDANGNITGTANAGDHITVSGTTSNGYVKTMKIVFGGTPAAETEAAKIAAATTSVDTAVNSKTNATRTAAQTLVTALAAGTAKDALQAKITAIVTAEDTAAEAAKVEAATAAVVKAEGSKLAVDKTAAQTAVNLLAVGTVRTGLQTRVTAIVVPVGVNELKGTFKTMLGMNYVTIAITAGKTPTSVKVDAVEASASNYSVDGTTLTILEVSETNVIKVTIDSVVYTVVK